MKIILTILLFALLVPTFAFAQSSTNPCSKNTADSGIVALPKCINQIYTWSLGAAALLALLMIILGGYSIMTAQGNGEQATKGKEYIYSAVIGLLLLFTAYLLLRTINPDLVNFQISGQCLDGAGNPVNAADPEACKNAGGRWDLFKPVLPSSPLPGTGTPTPLP
ncbi:MAG: hypothetical protein HY336_00420 [Candidatus Doudnabacteria bacterium]|nr:hypothetical protein [Candidatus Doudnabacteria bacterium]